MAAPPPPSYAVYGGAARELAAEDSMNAVLRSILPSLLLSSLTVVFFPGRWRTLREKLEHLQSSLAEASGYSGCFKQPLFLDLLPAILSALRSLQSLSDRCHDRSLPGGKLLLQSDLDIAASSLSLRLHDLDLLLRSGLLLRKSISEANRDNAIVLLQPRASASTEDLALFVRDLFTRLQIGGAEFKKEALESLISLFSTSTGGERIGALVAGEGDVSCLIHLMEASCEQHKAREQAAAAVCYLATASDISRKAVFEEGGLGPLLRLLESGSAPLMEKAAAAIESITAESSNAWAAPAYGGIPILVEACRRSQSPRIRSSAAGSLRNLAAHVLDVRAAMADEGAVPILLDLLSPSEDDGARKKAVQCLSLLATSSGDCDAESEKMRSCIIREGGLHKLLQFFREIGAVNSETAEHVLRGILAISASPSAINILSSSPPFLLHLAETIKHGNAVMQQLSAAVLSDIVLCEGMKRSMAGAMAPLVKLMETPKPVNSQEVAARALVSLLAIRANQKELCKDEKSMIKLVGLLDPANDWIRKELPVGVVCLLASGGVSCRRRLCSSGASQHLQKLAELEVAGARKALQKITSGRIRNLLSSIAWRE